MSTGLRTEFRRLQAMEMRTVSILLAQVHPRSDAADYCLEYPLFFDAESRAQLYGALVDGQLVAHVGTLLRTVNLDGVMMPAAVVGSVATAPAFRGRGLARELLLLAHQALKDAGIQLSFLWSEQRPLYEELGYMPVGRCLLVGVPSGAPAGLDVRPLTPARAGELWPLIEPRPGQLRHTREELARLLTIPRMEGFGLYEDGALAAYILVGKGADMPEIAHDFAGSAPAVLELVRTVNHRQSRAIRLLGPERGPCALAAEAGGRVEHLPVAMACQLQSNLALPPAVFSRLNQRTEQIKRAAGVSSNRPLIQRLFEPQLSGLPPDALHIWGLDSM